jgi:uncharacterized membrane protein YcaP (DUF421 family)
MSILEKINTDNDLIYILIRTAIIYIYAVILLRFVSSRFRLQTPFDLVVIVILGAVLGRTIYGGASLVATIASSILIVIIHEILAKLAFRYKLFGFIVKGKSRKLIDNGKINWDEMRASNITEDDLLEICHKNLKAEDLSVIHQARLERSGEITMIPKTQPHL